MSIRPLRVACTAAVVAFGLAQPALAQDQWSTDCSDEFCVFQSTAAVNGEVFAIVDLLIDVADGNASVVVTTPLGIAVEPGVLLQLGKAQLNVPVKVCEPDGCRASLDLGSEGFSLLLSTPRMDVRYIVFGAEQPEATSLDLGGLVTAITRNRP